MGVELLFCLAVTLSWNAITHNIVELVLCLAVTLSENAITQNMDFVKHFNVLLDLTSIYFPFLDGC